MQAKLFLDHKTLYYDVDPFMFYVMCEYVTHARPADSTASHLPVGTNTKCPGCVPRESGSGWFAAHTVLLADEYLLRELTWAVACWPWTMPRLVRAFMVVLVLVLHCVGSLLLGSLLLLLLLRYWPLGRWQVRLPRVPYHGLLFQGEVLRAGLQPGLYPYAAVLPAPWLR